MVNTDIIIIGGGAAGLMAACSAGYTNPGKNIILLEKNTRVGRKLLTTGNGRCNLSNTTVDTHYYHSQSMSHIEKILSECPSEDLLAFFSRMGLHTVIEDGRIYPHSQTASSVLDVLRLGADRFNVRTVTECDVRSVAFEKKPTGRFIVNGHNNSYSSNNLIIATGGKAAPSTGSDGAGYLFLTRLGHTEVPPYPVLTPLIVKHPILSSLKGLRVKPCRLTLTTNGHTLASDTGEVMFTEYGFSGIPAMQVSGAVNNQSHVVALLDLLPDITDNSVLEILHERRNYLTHLPAELLFTGIFHNRVGMALLKQAGIEMKQLCPSAITDRQMHTLARIIKSWAFDITDVKGFSSAQATGGGITLSEFAPATMESLRQPGLYAAGEVLDVYGDCGGYNLHWAWVTGYMAGQAAAQR